MKKFLSIIFITILYACKKDKAVEFVAVSTPNIYCTDTISFIGQIKPLFIQSCATMGCHNAMMGAGGYILENYNQISTNATIALKTMQHNGASPMPKAQPQLPDSIIQQFECWINQGKLNN